ncbi:MAG: winged helix-turn-helix domain-containing protein [Chloroflexota bacterium]
MRILIVEDDEKIALKLEKLLKEQNYGTDVSADGLDGEFKALTNDYDLIILDVRLPGKFGFEVCSTLRKEKVLVPILMLTALDAPDDIALGLNSGADDYLTKPFHIQEFLARVRSLLRRRSEQKTSVLEIADLKLDTVTRTVARSGKPIKLSSKEFALLEYFMLNAGRALSREMITEHVWDLNFDAQSNVIDSFVRFLRNKIDKDFDKPLIHTVRGYGYKLSELGE